MSSIVLGTTPNGKSVKAALDTLLATRLLIQANSGGGKSWAIRRIAEQAFDKVQIIIVDPEGEFSTLREKHGFVLAGPGGETSVNVRSAGLLAHRLLELHASAVCDIYELKSQERHAWVRTFCDSLVNAPKRLWQPVLIIVDEAHVYCPEKGQGESEAAGAMTDLVTRGRKRSFCPILATQRLGKLSKNVSAELLNRMVGPTFEDVDVKRAAELLGIPTSEQRAFYQERRTAAPGNFYAIGRAIAKEIVQFQVGEIETSHGAVGSKAFKAGAPPAPDSVAKLLPQLADLPAEAEQKAKTEADLRLEIKSLKAQLLARPIEVAEKIVEKTVEVPVLTDSQLEKLTVVCDKVSVSILELAGLVRKVAEFKRLPVPVVRPQLPAHTERTPASVRSVTPITPRAASTNGHDLKNPERKILNAIAWFESVGIMKPKLAAVAGVAGYVVTGGGFNNPRGALRSKGYIEYQDDRLVLTREGRAAAESPAAPLSTTEMHARVMAILPGPQLKIFTEALKVYPNPISKEDLARASGYEPTGGGFNNPCGNLRTLELITYPEKGFVKASDWLFLDGEAS